MKHLNTLLALLTMLWVCTMDANGQIRLLDKAKQKLEEKGNDAIDGLFGKKKNDNGSDNGRGQDYPEDDRDSRRRGSGSGDRKMTPPDVTENIADAKSALSSQSYSDARFAIHQAIIGIEYELGEEILASMPEKLQDMPMLKEQDEIYSSGIGFVGLNIKREYDNNNEWASASVMNNSGMLSSYNMMLTNAGYASTDEDYKVTKIGDYRAVMEYTGDGIKIAIPFGQSSLFLLELGAIEEENRAEELAALFDIARFKEILGEQ